MEGPDIAGAQLSPTTTVSPELDALAESLAAEHALAGKRDAKQGRLDSAETIIGTEEFAGLPQLPQSQDHIAVVKRLYYEIQELQAQVSTMSGELRQTRMANATLRAALKTRDEEALRYAEERAEFKKKNEELKSVVKGLREAWAQERKKANRAEPSSPYSDDVFYPQQQQQSAAPYRGGYDNRYQQQHSSQHLYQQHSMSALPPQAPQQHQNQSYSHFQQQGRIWGPQSYSPTPSVNSNGNNMSNPGLEAAFRSVSISSFSSNEDFSPRSYGSNA